jgi:hypothetical protein
MNAYFFKVTPEERENILDKHKTVYDGYVTEYAQNSNQQPLYVQDFANDKEGITVSNKGVVKTYTNMNINESHLPIDYIADGEYDLENGTIDIDSLEVDEDYEYDIDELDDFSSEPLNELEVDEEDLPEVMDSIQESLDMFKRFKKYN